jgi:diadenylate cyclase
LAQLDGAFVISDEGVVVSACRYLDATASGVEMPLGLGSRHFAAASISTVTQTIAIVVSESAMVRVFDDGKLIAEVLPELWLLSRYSVQLRGPFSEERFRDLTVLVTQDDAALPMAKGEVSDSVRCDASHLPKAK